VARARVIVCNTMDPFVTGGSELFASKLTEQLNAAGHEAILVTFPFRPPKFDAGFLESGALPWRSLDLSAMADVVIPMRFPTWLVQHPNKVVYLNHQLRVAYELFGTAHGPKANERTLQARQHVIACDAELGQAKKIFAVSRNVQQRLQSFNGLESELLYHGLPHEGQYHAGPSGSYILGVGRLVTMKRFHLLIEAMAHTRTPVTCQIVGEGRERAALEDLVARLGVEGKVRLLGWRTHQELLDLYAGALGVYYAPVDEDYGLVTLEAFNSGKPVLAATDSGGVLEFVQEGLNGRVLPPEPIAFAEAIDQWYLDRELARRQGEAGAESVRHITWRDCVERLGEFF
jgi:glycosyltransferase involved in cell wall biosynthesis